MENYEQKYKEALERASHIKDNNTVATPQEVAEFLFPELKETEDGNIRKEIIEYITRYKDCITDKEYDSWIAWLEKQGEQTSAWSQEDETNMDAVWRACGQAYGIDYQGILGDWLKLLKDRVQPQPKQEWSEDDKEILNKIIHNIEFPSGVTAYRKPIDEMVSWLKSIKPNHWKPSNEQMQALFEAKLASIKNREYFLGLLYEDLKKL